MSRNVLKSETNNIFATLSSQVKEDALVAAGAAGLKLGDWLDMVIRDYLDRHPLPYHLHGRDFWTVPQAARYCKVTRANIDHHIKRGNLTPVLTGPARYLDAADVKRFAESLPRRRGPKT